MRKKHAVSVRFVPGVHHQTVEECLTLAEVAEEVGNVEHREFWLNQAIRLETLHAPIVPGKLLAQITPNLSVRERA